MTASRLKVTVILPGRRTDQGYNKAMFEGSRKAAAGLGFRLKVREGIGVGKIREVLKEESERGAELIFAHSIDYQRALKEAAPRFPGTQYVIHPSFGFDPAGLTNVVAMDDRLEEGAYLAGVLGSGLTKTGVIGFIGGKRYSSQIAFANAYRLGAIKYMKQVKVVLHFTEVWTDKQAGRRGVDRVSTEGADFILFRGDGITLGGIEECSKRHLLAVGDLWDQNSLAPATVISSNIWRMDVPVKRIVKMHSRGELEGWKAFAWGVREGACGLAPYHRLSRRVPPVIKERVEQERQEIVSGKLVVPFDTEEERGTFVSV